MASASASEVEQAAVSGPPSALQLPAPALPAEVVETILGHLSTAQRAQLATVCSHWNEVQRKSRTLWTSTVLYLDRIGTEQVAGLATWLRHRAAGISELELHFSTSGWVGTVAFLLGVLGEGLRRVELCGIRCSVSRDIPSLHWLGCLNAQRLEALHLKECVGVFPPGLTRLTSLKELVINHSHHHDVSYLVVPGLSSLVALTRLELIGLAALPVTLSALTGLQLLVLGAARHRVWTAAELSRQLAPLTDLEELQLEDCELDDLPAVLSTLRGLTCLGLPGCFEGRPWGSSTWEQKLKGLSVLTGLQYLDVSDCNLPEVPATIANLPKLCTLKVGGNPLAEGLVEGPWPALEHLDLHGSSIPDLLEGLCSASRLEFLGLACCHSLQLDRELVERVLGRLQALTQITLCGSMLESVDAAKALLTLGRMLPNVEVLSQDEVDEEAEDGHHHNVADPHGHYYSESSDEEETDEEEYTTEEEDSEGEEGESEFEGSEEEDAW